MAEKQANMNDIANLCRLLDLMKMEKHTIKEIGEKTGVSPATLYYFRSTKRISEKMCYYICSKIQECFPEDYKKIYADLDTILNGGLSCNAVL